MTAVLPKPNPAEQSTAPAALSAGEVKRRVAVLKRFRELLNQQRERFRQYLDVLDKQKDVIEGGSADDLISHVELEEKIVTDIFAIQKVIDPLEEMYRTASRGVSGETAASGRTAAAGPASAEVSNEEREVPSLKAALEELKAEAVVRSQRNRELLTKRMEELRLEMKTLRAHPYAIHRSAYSSESASLVDIKG
jgi:hypothetical protein